MRRTKTITVRLGGGLGDFVSARAGEDGPCENVAEYARDPIHRDEEQSGRESFGRLKAELARAFAAPDGSFHPLSASEVIARNKARHGA